MSAAERTMYVQQILTLHTFARASPGNNELELVNKNMSDKK
jgi:hypothetical protein